MKPALESCNFLVYGYIGIDPLNYELKLSNPSLDNELIHQLTTILKQQFPQLILLLSVGGRRDDNFAVDDENSLKYLKLLENLAYRTAFINSAQKIVKTYGFHGLDLAWQFPETPASQHSNNSLKRAWMALKTWFNPPKPIDPQAEQHKGQFLQFLRELRNGLSTVGSIVTLTVLPNVDVSGE